MQNPGFLFSPVHVLRDIRFFNPQQKSCYLEILTAHHQHRRFSPDALLTITTELTESERAEFLEVFEHDRGGYFIGWADAAIEKRLAYLSSRSNNKKGKTKTKKQRAVVRDKREVPDAAAFESAAISKSCDFDMENENENENKNENKTENRNGTETKQRKIKKRVTSIC